MAINPLRICLLLALLIVVASPAKPQTSDTFTYDALGRLVGVAKSDGSDDGQAVALGYGPAGKRSAFAVVPATLSIANASSNEGASLNFTVTRTGATSATVTVPWV